MPHKGLRFGADYHGVIVQGTQTTRYGRGSYGNRQDRDLLQTSLSSSALRVAALRVLTPSLDMMLRTWALAV